MNKSMNIKDSSYRRRNRPTNGSEGILDYSTLENRYLLTTFFIDSVGDDASGLLLTLYRNYQ